MSGRSQPKVSGHLPRLPPALQQPQPQSQQLPALPHRYVHIWMSGEHIWPQGPVSCFRHAHPATHPPSLPLLLSSSGFDSNCCNGVTSNKSHSSSPHSHKPCPPSSGSALPASDISINGSRSQQPLTRYTSTNHVQSVLTFYI